jgi:HK97 family phage prohead protease
MLYKKSYIEKTFIDGKDTYRFKITQNNIDRVGDRLIVAGLDVSEYMENNIILFNHDTDKPIGTSILEFNEDKTMLFAVATFDEVTQLSKDVKGMIDAGTLKTASIGFQGTEFLDRVPTEEEKAQIANRPYLKRITDITKSILYEWSVAPIPANPKAARQKYLLQRAMAKGFDTEMIKELGIENEVIIANEVTEIITDIKAGAVINSKNMQKLNNAIQLLNEVIESAQTENEKIINTDIVAKKEINLIDKLLKRIPNG